MNPKGKDKDHLGPVNPFTVGNVFIEAAMKLEWIVEEKTERQRQFYITSKGFEEMSKLGMNIEKALLYREPPAQEARRAHPQPRHRPRDHRRH